MALSLNVPEFNLAARLFGDASSLAKQGIPVQRGVNRAMGRAAGKVFGGVNATFGVWGMIATAQFLSVLRQVVDLQVAQNAGKIHIVSSVRYATLYHNGSPTAAPRPFLRNAFEQVPFKASRKWRAPRTIRGGLYQGQRFVDDFAGFYRGDVSRLARRAAGRQIAGFTWGTLRVGAETQRPNILESYIKRVTVQARKNIKSMGEDTGTLRHSVVYAFSSEEASQLSYQKAFDHMARRGIGGQIPDRLISGTIPEGAGGLMGLSGAIRK